MLYKINSIQKKTTTTGKELAEVNVVDVSGQTLQATIWKLDKEGQVFPNYDTLMVGSQIDGNAWNSPKDGKVTIYPQKPFKTHSGAFGRPSIAAAQQRKETSIVIAQENKSEGIKLSSTIRMATDIVIAQGITDRSDTLVEKDILKWRKWFWSNWDNHDMSGFTSNGEKVPDFEEIDMPF